MTEIVSDHVDSYVFRRVGEKVEYLLLRRQEGKVFGHLWQGVAGRKQEGETAVETVMRELKEETGLEPVRLIVVDHVTSFYQSYNDRMHLVPVFGVEVNSENVRLSGEHAEYRWVDIKAALDLLSWKQQKDAIAILDDMLIHRDERLEWSEVDRSKRGFHDPGR